VRHFERWEFELPRNPDLTEEEVEVLARKVHEEDDPEALRLLQSQFFAFLCEIVWEVEEDLSLGTELREDDLDPSRTRSVPIPPWRHNSEIPGVDAAMDLLLGEFHRQLLFKFDPDKGPFKPWLFTYGRLNLLAELHKAIARGNPEAFEWDGHARRARLRHERISTFSVPVEELEEHWNLEQHAYHAKSTSTTEEEIERLLVLLWYSNRRPDAVPWQVVASEGELEVIIEYVLAKDAELAAERLQERGRRIKPETVKRIGRRVLSRAKRELEFLRPERKVEGEGQYGKSTGERVRLKRQLRRWLGEDAESTNSNSEQ
jgi:hypothetical protein